MATTEEPVPPIEPASEQPAVVDPATGETHLGAEEPKTRKVPAQKKRTSPTHPTYFEMIKDAIVALKDRTGSSQYAITKFIEDKQKHLPSNFRKVLLVQLRKLVANDKLVKVKSSFKLPSAHSVKPPAPMKKKSVSVLKPKPKAVGTKAKKAVAVPKPKMKAENTAAVKSKAADAVVKSKSVAKAKSAAKPKATTPVKAKTASKRKAPEKAKTEKKPLAKVAKTSARSTPGKKAAAAVPAKKAPGAQAKKVIAKSVKPKSLKSPAKKAVAKKLRK
ncbi:hypothetical protein OROGR_002777 [Orobanche gracilis]